MWPTLNQCDVEPMFDIEPTLSQHNVTTLDQHEIKVHNQYILFRMCGPRHCGYFMDGSMFMGCEQITMETITVSKSAAIQVSADSN